MTAAALLGTARERLAATGSDTARLDAEVLLAHALGVGRAALYARLREEVAAEAAARFESLLGRRERREPVAYLTGEQEFWSLSFTVTPDVLIPRPETELIVQVGLERLRSPHPGRGEGMRGRAILDLGTGSGCLAVALAREVRDAQVIAVDLAPAALAVARRNAERHGVADRVAFVAGDLYDPLPASATFDLVVSNPPYLASGDAVVPELAFEPRAALFAGADGLALIRRLVAGAPARLRPGGLLLVEIGQGQADAALGLAAAAGLAVRVAPDLAGIPRLLVAQRPESGRGG